MKKEILGGLALLAAFVGIVTFIIGNWTSWMTTEGLANLAWISSMALVVAAITGALWWMFKQQDFPAGCAFFTLEGMVLGLLGIVLWFMDGFNPDFVGEMFKHPFAGILCIGLWAMTAIIGVNAKETFSDNDKFAAWFYIVGALFMFTTAMAISGTAWVIPIDTVSVNIFSCVALGCIAIMTAMIIGTIATKKW